MATENRPAGAQLVIRWSADKTLSGLHIQYTEQVIDLDTGLAIAVVDGPAIPIGDAAGAVLLVDAVGEVAAAALQAEHVEHGLRLAAEAERDAQAAARQQAEAERDQRAAERDALQAELDQVRGAHGPDFIPQDVFMDRWKTAELAAFYAAKSFDPMLEAFDALVTRIGGVRIGSERAVDGRAYLIERGILSAERADAVFAPVSA